MMTHAEAVALIERTLQDYLLGRVRREPRLAEHLATLLGFTDPGRARAILRDVARGDIVLPSREPAPAALPPEAHQFYADLNRRATAVDLKLARRHQ